MRATYCRPRPFQMFCTGGFSFSTRQQQHKATSENSSTAKMTSTPATISTSSSPSIPSRKEVDAALNYILRKNKQDVMYSSPRSVTQVSQDTQDYETNNESTTTNNTSVNDRNIISDEQNDACSPCFGDLAEGSSARIMSDMLRSAFTSQVFSKNINHKGRRIVEEKDPQINKNDC